MNINSIGLLVAARSLAAIRQTATVLFLLAASTEIASANIVFDFSGACSSGCTGTATGVLTLTNDYVYGSDITTSDFVSYQETSSQNNFTIDTAGFLQGGLFSNGSFNAQGDIKIEDGTDTKLFEAFSFGVFIAYPSSYGPSTDQGFSFTFTNVTTAVPEPSTWAMMVLGFFGIGFMAYRRRQSGPHFA